MKKLHTFMVAAASSALLLSMETHAQEITTGSNTQCDTTYTNLKEATVSVSRLVFVTKNDTIVYDMDALNASEGDMLGDIIQKMPGLELRDGTLYFKGRAVDRLMVNGVDFQRGDTKRALSILPAYVIKSVKAYEGQTDKAKVTGLDDGVKENVVDVILRREYLGTWTGNADLGGGTDHRWLLRGFANTFTDRMRVSVYGGATNTGIYQSVGNDGNWSDNDYSSGDTRFIIPGASFMWMNRKKQDEGGFFKVETNLNWDYRGHNDFNAAQTEQLLSDQSMKFDISRQTSKNDQKVLGASLYFTWKPSKNTHIEYGPNYSYTQTVDKTWAQMGEWDKSYFDVFLPALDSVATSGYNGSYMEKLKLLTREHAYSDSKSHNYSHWLWATQKLTESNWRISLRNQLSYSKFDNKGFNLKSYKYFQQAGATKMGPLYNRYNPEGTRQSSMMNFIDLNIPLPLFQSLQFTYGFEYSHNHDFSNGYRLERAGGVFADFDAYLTQFGTLPTVNDWEKLTRDADITSNSITDQQRHWFETQLTYKKGQIFGSFQATGKVRHDEISYWKLGYEAINPSKKSGEFLINSKIKWERSGGNYTSLNYYYETRPAAFSYEVTIPETSDPLNVTIGNAGLKAQRTHSAYIDNSRTFKGGKNLMFSLLWSNLINDVAFLRVYDKETGVTTSKPVNICGNWHIKAATFYSMSLDKNQHVNWSVSLRYMFQHSPNYGISVEKSPIRRSDINQSVNLYNTLNMRWESGNLDLTANATYSYAQTELVVKTKNDTWQFSYGINGKQKLFWDVDLSTQLGILHRIGYDNSTIKSVRTIWNIFLSKSFLRDKSMSVKLELSDLLNQRGRYWGSTSADMRRYVYSTCVKRYFMAHLIYRFSTKKRK